ncbi:MAG: ABC transporter ATP-binding protein [Acidaminococcaceae bacterium]
MTKVLFEAQQLCFHEKICYANLTIPAEQTTFIVGPSGTGKSTLLRLFNAVLSPTHGTIFFEGRDLATLDTITLRQQVLLISQAVYLFDGTIRDNFLQYYAHRELPLPSDSSMLEFLRLCGVTFPLDATCNTMSGGEKQRVYLAIFLSFQPRVLMLDEPTSALDTTTGHQVIANILTFCRQTGITVLIVSHDHTLTEQFADNVLTLERVAGHA